MSNTKPKVRRQMLILFCALLLFGQIFASVAYADTEKDMNIGVKVGTAKAAGTYTDTLTFSFRIVNKQ